MFLSASVGKLLVRSERGAYVDQKVIDLERSGNNLEVLRAKVFNRSSKVLINILINNE